MEARTRREKFEFEILVVAKQTRKNHDLEEQDRSCQPSPKARTRIREVGSKIRSLNPRGLVDGEDDSDDDERWRADHKGIIGIRKAHVKFGVQFSKQGTRISSL